MSLLTRLRQLPGPQAHLAPDPEPPGHSHSHAHGHAHGPSGSSQAGRTLLAVLLVPCFVAVLVGIVAFWPSDRKITVDPGVAPSQVVDATVTAVRESACGSGAAPGDSDQPCLQATFRLGSGELTELEVDPNASQPPVSVGDGVKLSVYDDPSGVPAYVFTDFQRDQPLLLLSLLTAAVVIGVARWRGFAALMGVGIAGAGLVLWVLPSLLDGNSPVLVALTGAGALLPLLLYLAHGFSARTSSALAGTLLALGLCAGLSVLSVHIADLTGLSSDDAVTLQSFDGHLDITQLLICGFIIGALGALNDVTITQASAVWELSAAGVSRLEAYRRAMRIGRDHIASSVYTLVFAYAGTALPLLLLFVVLDQPLLNVATSDLIAIELVRTMVGTVGLVASVPMTTAIAAWAAAGRPEPATPAAVDAVQDPEGPVAYAWDQP